MRFNLNESFGGVIKDRKYRDWLKTFEIIFDEITPVGEVKFYFSEPLKAI